MIGAVSRTSVWSLIICISGLALIATADGQESSPAGCRAALRPVLLQSSPDSALLSDIFRLCEGQARAGDPDALYGLSLLHLGLIDWKPEQAIEMMRSAADSGIPEAQYWLGWQYDAGPLLDNDAELALYWYLQAAEREHRLALARLAVVYANGELGVAVDMKKAAVYRARAARCNN